MYVYVRHVISMVASAAVLMAMILVGSSPAQAATFVDLSVSDTSISLGETVYISWDSEDAETLVASGDWSGDKVIDGFTEEAVTPTAAGSYTYTLTATDSSGNEDVSSVTVEVDGNPATPLSGVAAVTFPDPCTVIIPETPNVTYYVQYGGDSYEPIESGTTPGTFFFNNDGEAVRLFVRANEGFVLADGQTTEWFYTASEDCLDFGPQLVSVEVDCGKARFTNVFTESVFVQAGDANAEEPDEAFSLEPGESKTVSTKLAELYFATSDSTNAAHHYEIVDVPQDCDAAGGTSEDDDHPTVAPAAGR